MKRKAIALISGGLDSLLAARVIMEQGIEVQGVCFVMSFASKNIKSFIDNVKEASSLAKIPVEIVDFAEEFLEVVKNPKHGYGANINPCIDCKIFMLQKAKSLMDKYDAGFIVTGEVLGERPMSQRRAALNIIQKQSTLEGLLLRPLSAKLMKETLPEEEGVVDRAKLLDMKGRGRKKQFALAEELGITKYFAPAGGCLLTDPRFTDRLQDLIVRDMMDEKEIKLLKYGRHFRLDEKTKVVVGRNEEENDALLRIKNNDDVGFVLHEKVGPYVLLRSIINDKT